MDVWFQDDAAPVAIQIRLTEPDVPIVAVRGEIDETNDDLISGEISNQLARCAPVVVVDLREVTFIGSAGLRLLLDRHFAAEEAGIKLAVVANRRVVLRLLEVTELDQILNVHDDIPAALGSLARDGGQHLTAGCGPHAD